MADKTEQCKSCKMGCPQEIVQAKLNSGRIPFDKCLDFTPRQTNADRIRAMSDEELAEFLVNVETQGYCDQSVAGTLEMSDWLQSEVEE